MNRRAARATASRVLLAVVGLFAVSCTGADAPMAPKRPALRSQHSLTGENVQVVGPAARMPALTAAEATVSMWDEVTGVAYTLNTATGELAASDGSNAVLDAELTALVATQIAGTPEADQTASDLEALALGFWGGGGPDGGPCGGRPCEMTSKLPDTPAGVLPRPRARGVTVMWRRAEGPLHPRRQGRTAPVGFMLTLGGGGDMCQDVINAALPTTWEYKTQRSGFLRSFFDLLKGAGISRVMARVPYASSLGAELEKLSVDYANARIAVGVLGFYWTVYDCGSQVVRAHEILVVGTGGSGPVGTKVCHDENWQISFNGGQTWGNIVVSVCHYEHTA